MKKLTLLLLGLLLSFGTATAIPMPDPAIMTTNDDYDISSILRGRSYDLILKGTFGGATVNLQYLNQATGAWDTAQTFTAAADYLHLAQNSKARLNVTGGSGASINVAFFLSDPLSKNRPLTPSSITSSGPVTAPNYLAGNGSAATPSYSFTNFPSSGWYYVPGSGLRASLGGTDVASLTSTGLNNTVIGASSPAAGGFTTLTANSVSSTIFGGSQLSFRPNGVGSTTNQVTIDTSGLVAATGGFSGPIGATGVSTGAFTTITGSSLVTTGNVTAASVAAGVSGQLGFTASGGLRRNADGDFSFRNAANAANGNITAALVTFSGLTDSGKSLAAPGATGNRTANTASGSIRLALGTSTATLTNSSITTNTILALGMKGNDASARDLRYTTSAGQAVITVAVAPAAELEITWVVFN